MDVDLEAVLARIRADRAEAEAQLRAAQARLEQLASMEESVRVAAIAAEKYGQSIQATKRTDRRPAAEPGWVSLTNKEAAVAALTAIGRPASTREIYEKLRSVGRTENFDQVRAALSDLKRRGQLGKASREQWQPPRTKDSRNTVPANVTELHPAVPEKAPTGSNAARQVLQSDPARFWTVREVWEEQVRRNWAKPTEDGREAVRTALSRLRRSEPRVQFVEEPKHAYRWVAQEIAPSDGSGHVGA